MVDKLYDAVAEKHGVTAKEVEIEIRKAIAEAYRNSPDLSDAFPGEKSPEPDEVIAYVLSKIYGSCCS